jgi:orotidine-5'-phosphate decarboxylase
MQRVIVAFDNMTKEDAENFLDSYGKKLTTIKIGLEMFCRYGRGFIEELNKKYEHDIFLDLKLHDIPTTVAKSIRSLEGLRIKFLTIHLSGGEEMVKQALEARDKYLPQTKILGVSVLTSLDDNDTQQIFNANTRESFKRLEQVAINTGICGIVSSAHELELLTKKEFIKVCPGIRIENSEGHDQKRVMTPKEAFALGADFLVIGRSITLNPEVLNKIEKYL